MTVRRVGHYLRWPAHKSGPRLWWQCTCDGCGASDHTESAGAGRRRPWDGPPAGWRRLRAGDAQVDLCAACLRIGVWRDDPMADAWERWGRLEAMHEEINAALMREAAG